MFQLNALSSHQSGVESEKGTEGDDREVYQQVKYFRHSIHEVNQLVGDSDEVYEASEVEETLMDESGTSHNEPQETESTSMCEESENYVAEYVTSCELQSCEDVSKEDNALPSQFCDTMIMDNVVVQLRHPERRTSSESGDSPAHVSSESSHSSPEHRRSSGLDPNPNRRKFESEIGRDILRERKMKQELEEMRSSNHGKLLIEKIM